MQTSERGARSAFRPYGTTAGRAVAHRRPVIVSRLAQAPQGRPARQIQETPGFSKDLTASALTGLFVHGWVHKHQHCYVLTAFAEAVLA